MKFTYLSIIIVAVCTATIQPFFSTFGFACASNINSCYGFNKSTPWFSTSYTCFCFGCIVKKSCGQFDRRSKVSLHSQQCFNLFGTSRIYITGINYNFGWRAQCKWIKCTSYCICTGCESLHYFTLTSDTNNIVTVPSTGRCGPKTASKGIIFLIYTKPMRTC